MSVKPPCIPLNYPQKEWWFESKSGGGIDGKWLVTVDCKTGELHCECISSSVRKYCWHMDKVMTEVTGKLWKQGKEVG